MQPQIHNIGVCSNLSCMYAYNTAGLYLYMQVCSDTLPRTRPMAGSHWCYLCAFIGNVKHACTGISLNKMADSCH